MKIVASLPDPTTISYCSREGSKIMRRIISGSARWIFPRIRWTGDRGDSASGSDDMTGVLDIAVTLAFVLMIVVRYKCPENINPAIAGEIKIVLKNPVRKSYPHSVGEHLLPCIPPNPASVKFLHLSRPPLHAISPGVFDRTMSSIHRTGGGA